MVVATIVLISVILPVAFLVMIILAASKKNREDIARAEHSLRNVYIYTLLIILLFTIIFCSIYAFRLGLDLLFPEEETYRYSYSYASPQYQRNVDLVNLFTQISMVIVAIPLFTKHSKLAKK